MNTKKVLIGGIVGGIAYFLMGWLIYGVLLMDFMTSNSTAGVMKTQDQFIWSALVVSNLIYGLLMSYVINAVGHITSSGKGAITAATTGLLVVAGYDLGMYATSNVSTMNVVLADIAAVTVMSFIAGAIIVMVSNKIK